ncbi:hypothetical protein [Robertkochia flava]|uniref:hypothetical protein n=1 Tax=Robertkochia flava TaxID=3447986 RepID=UPI001CCE7F09|nr:hypothetical protein [Robertkochia marina]
MMATNHNTRIVTLRVDTSNVDQTNLHETCDFGPQQEAQNASLEDFYIEVDKNDEVIWEGVSKNGKDEVIIEVISWKDGIPAFGQNVNVLSRGPNPGTVSCRIRNNTGKPGNCRYNIIFSVSNKMGTYTIDPDIRIR